MGKNKRRKRRGLKAFLIILLVLVGLPVGSYFAFIYTNVGEKLTFEEVDFKEKTNEMLVDSLDYVTNDEKGNPISLKIKEDDLNGLLAGVANKFIGGTPFESYLNNFYVDISEDSYKFVLEVKVTKLVSTSLIIDTTLKEENDTNGNYFLFRINTIKIGRIKGLQKLIKKFITNEKIESALADAGLHMNVDLENAEIHYYEKDIISDIEALAGNDQTEMYFTIIEDMLNMNLLQFSTGENETSIDFKLSTLKRNDLVHDDTKETNIPLTSYDTKLETLMNNQIITKDGLGDMMTYLIHGYTFIHDQQPEVESKISALDLSSIGINDFTTYEPEGKTSINSTTNPNYMDIQDAFFSTINLENFVATKEIGRLSEERINNYIAATSIVGFSVFLSRQLDDGTYKVSYVVLEDFYCDIIDDGINYIFGLNINGCKIELALETGVKEVNGSEVIFEAKDIYLGNTKCSEKMKNFLFKTMEDNFNSDETLNVQMGGGTIAYDFSSSLTDWEYGSLIDWNTINGKCIGGDGNGAITLNADLGEIPFPPLP